MKLFPLRFQRTRDRKAEKERYSRRLALHADARPVGDDRTARAILLWVLCIITLAITWAAVTPVVETVTGEGRILPIGGARPAQTLDGGLVVEVLVADGEWVVAGQPLVRIDRTEEKLLVRRLETRLQGLIAERGRFASVAEGRVFLAPDTPAGREQSRVHTAELALEAALVDRLRVAQEAAQNRVTISEARISSLRKELELAEAAEARAASLLERGSASVKAAEDTKRMKLRVAQELVEAESLAIEARFAAIEARIAQGSHLAERRARAAERVASLSAEIAELDKEIARTDERASRDQVFAPVTGRVQDLAVRDPGQTVLSGATVALVLPQSDVLFADMRLSADRMANVSVGVEASIKVLAFDYARFGAIPGEVVAVSPSSEIDQNGNASFRVRLRLDLEQAGAIQVRPGLSVTVDLQTGEKTVLEYFAKPLRVLRDRAFSEA